jgi:uncharacterized protein YbjT (DUF2867 family)
MRLLILGANGGTGRQLVGQALESGDEVTAFVRSPPPYSPSQAEESREGVRRARASRCVAAIRATGRNSRARYRLTTRCCPHLVHQECGQQQSCAIMSH